MSQMNDCSKLLFHQKETYHEREKLKILRLHLLKKKAISELCEEHNIYPTQLYKWQKTLFENGIEVFKQQSRFLNCHTRKIKELEGKLIKAKKTMGIVGHKVGFSRNSR